MSATRSDCAEKLRAACKCIHVGEHCVQCDAAEELERQQAKITELNDLLKLLANPDRAYLVSEIERLRQTVVEREAAVTAVWDLVRKLKADCAVLLELLREARSEGVESMGDGLLARIDAALEPR